MPNKQDNHDQTDIWLTEVLAKSRLQCKGAGISRHEPGWTYPHDPFTDYDVHYVFEGGAAYDFPDGVFTTGAGDLFFMPPAIKFLERDNEKNMGVSMLSCHFQFITADGVDPLKSLKLPTVIPSPNRSYSDALALELIRLTSLSRTGSRWRHLTLLGRLMEWFSWWFEYAIDAAYLNVREEFFAPEWLSSILTFIDHNLTDTNLDVESMALQAGLSSSHFAHEFSKYTGIAPMKLVQEKRMERACNFLLNEPNMTIKEIAANCGFKDQYYFSAQFKKHNDHAPTMWREIRFVTDR